MLSAATRNAVGRGEGSVNGCADTQMVFVGDRLRDDRPAARPQPRGRERRSPLTSWLGGIGCAAVRGGASTQTRRSP